MSQLQQPATGVRPARPGGGQPTGGGQRQSLLFRTQNHLPDDVRASMVQRLNGLLADATVLMTHAKVAHWNLKGMAFYSLHGLFDDLAEALAEHADLLAERATALGGQAVGTARAAADATSIPDLPTDAVTGEQYVRLVADRLAAHDAELARGIQAASDAGDLDTADLLNEVSRTVSKYLWFLESHLQTTPASSVALSGGGVPAGGGQPTTGGYPTPVQQ